MTERHLLLQLSDLHISPSGYIVERADPLGNLDTAIAHIVSSRVRPEAVLFTGDLVDGGDPDGYVTLKRRASSLSAATGATAIFIPGNHDDRRAFRQYLLDEEPSDEPIDQVHWCGGLRIISLDTVVPGSDGGALRPGQLRWLGFELRSSAPDGTILALHHPPVSSPVISMASLALADPGSLGEAIASSDVFVVVCGHNHHASAGMLGHVPVWVSPALAYRADPLIERTWSTYPDAAFTRIDVSDHRALMSLVQLVSQPLNNEVLSSSDPSHAMNAGQARGGRDA